VRVRALVVLDGGRFAETDPPARLASRSVTALNVYGSLFFAGARTLAEHLPDPHDAEHAAVVLRLRGRTSVGATLIDVLGDYADELADAGGRLFLTGVSRKVAAQLEHSGKFDLDHTVRIVAAGEILGASTGEALRLAHAWLASVAADAPNHR
jgi:SulP family sulfate permease